MRMQCLLGIGVVALLACGDDRTGPANPSQTDSGPTLPPVASPAVRIEGQGGGAVAWAQLQPANGAEQALTGVSGTIRFEPSGDGLRVRAELEGLPPGKHGVRVHERGDCNEPGSQYSFGAPAATEVAGDLGEITVDSSGRAQFEGVVQTAQIEGERTIVGRTVVVHAGEDGTGDATDTAGPGIACGVIQSNAS